MRKINAVKAAIWLLFGAGLAAGTAQAASVHAPPPRMSEVLPVPPGGYAPLPGQMVTPHAYYHYNPTGRPGDGGGGGPAEAMVEHFFPDGLPEWLLPKRWTMGRTDWSKDPHDLYRTLALGAKRYTFLEHAVQGFYGTVATSTGPVVLNLISFTGAPVGQQCNTRLGPVRIDTDPLYGSPPSLGSLTLQRGHWVGHVSIQVGSFPEPLPPVTVPDLLLVEQVAMEMDARIFSWELWGKVNTVEALAMLPGVVIEENQAKPTEQLSERKIWLPISPRETDPILAPVEFLVQKLGGEWKWDEETGTGEVVVGDKTISLTAGSQEVVMNGESLHFDHAPQLASPTLCIPLEMAKTLFQGLIEIQPPQADATVPEEAGQAAG